MNPEKLIGEVAQAVGGSGGGFLGSLLSAPFSAISGMAKGVFGSLWNGLLLSGGIMAVKSFFPQYWSAALHAIGGKELADRTAKDVVEGGLPGMALQSAKEGFSIAALWGGANGMLDGVGKSFSGGRDDSGSGIGSTIGTLATVGAVGLVVVGALSKNGVKPAGDAGPAGPAATPPVTARPAPQSPAK
jgi:hypothetical protein